MPLLGARRGAITGVRVPRQRILAQNLLPDPGTELEAFENDADWVAGNANSVIADEAALYKAGAQAVRLTAVAAGQANMTKTVSWDVSGYKAFRLWVYRDHAFTPDSVTLYLSSTSNFSKLMSANVALVSGWNLVQIPLGDWTAVGGATWADTVIRFRIRIDPSAATAIVCDEFRGIGAATGALALHFDDGWVSEYNEAFTYARQYGIKATIYMISSYAGVAGYLTVPQMVEMDAHGWDIANHTDTATLLTTLSEAQQETALATAQAALDGWGLTRASRHVAYPNGASNADTLTAMAATGMLTGRSTRQVRTLLPFYDNYAVPSIVVANTTSLQTIKGYIRTVIDRGEVCILYMHDIVANPASAVQWPIRDWRALCEFIASAGIPTLTISELYALQSGALTVQMPY